MRIEPLGDKVVVKRTEADEMTAGGIVLPGAAREKPQEGKILSVGSGRVLALSLIHISEPTRPY